MTLSNEDIFIIFGQNGIISFVFIILWICIYPLRIGRSYTTTFKFLTMVCRAALHLFFFKFMFIAISEIAIHDPYLV